jgi:SMC interacting uncharacterized protein involved in chromosome segregation
MGKVATFFSSQSIPVDGQTRVKMLQLDAKFEKMESEIQVLKADNLKLKSQVKPLESKVERLKERIAEMEAEALQASEEVLDEKAHKLLAAIANRDRLTEERAQALIGGPRARIDYYLSLLRARGLIRLPMVAYGSESRYRATDEGLAYLRKIGKI